MVKRTFIIAAIGLWCSTIGQAQVRITEFGARPIVLKPAQEDITPEIERPALALFTDHVLGDLQTRAMTITSFTRRTWRQDNAYYVEVKDALGTLRMSGTYLDQDLTKRQGEFHYYHPNGRLGAIGKVHEDLKWGEWKRFDRNGTPLNEKHYGLMDAYEMALHYGWIEVACTAREINQVRSITSN